MSEFSQLIALRVIKMIERTSLSNPPVAQNGHSIAGFHHRPLVRDKQNCIEIIILALE